jgi:anaerobic selenocysteine-containing dehydrogenase
MNRQVLCQRCGRPLSPSKESDGVAAVVRCQDCKQQIFAERLLGDRLQKVEPVRHAPKRRRENLETLKHDSLRGTTVYKTECFICNQGCDARVHVKDGSVVLVEGDPSSPVTKGTLCAKGLASKGILYHPDRLLYPMRRVGKRGEGKWERISWDEAYDAVVTNLNSIEQKYGPDSILLATGTNRGWVGYFTRFANAYGKQCMGPGIAQCWFPRMSAQILTFGATPIENPYYEGSRCLLVWGCNPTSTWPAKGVNLMDARSRGAKMIVVDPLLCEAASKADLWLQLRPGTDAALALGMLHVIINERLYDKEFVDRWCFGFDEFKKRVEEFPPERVAQITWVPKELIIEAARLYAVTKPASITECLSIDQNADTISTTRSLSALAAITGNIDVPGGNVITMPKTLHGRKEESGIGYLTKEHHEKRLGAKEYPLLAGEACVMSSPSAHNRTVWQAVLTGRPYPIRAIYCHGNNMLQAYANTTMVKEALMSLDFFVVADLFMTDTARLADILLPCASWMERGGVALHDQTSFNGFHLQQKIAEVGECRTDITVLNELAAKLGFGARMFPSDEAYFDFLLQPSGITYEEFKRKGLISFPDTFKKYEANGFNTPSRKVQLYDPRLEELGFDPLPAYIEPTESPVSTPELARDYPLIITTGGRVPVFRHSELRNIPVLREIVPDLLVSINPRTAVELGLQDGDAVLVESLRGRMEAKASLTEGIDPGVVQVPSHWPGENNVNYLMDNEACAPMIGSIQLRCQLCRVQKKGQKQAERKAQDKDATPLG